MKGCSPDHHGRCFSRWLDLVVLVPKRWSPASDHVPERAPPSEAGRIYRIHAAVFSVVSGGAGVLAVWSKVQVLSSEQRPQRISVLVVGSEGPPRAVFRMSPQRKEGIIPIAPRSR